MIIKKSKLERYDPIKHQKYAELAKLEEEIFSLRITVNENQIDFLGEFSIQVELDTEHILSSNALLKSFLDRLYITYETDNWVIEYYEWKKFISKSFTQALKEAAKLHISQDKQNRKKFLKLFQKVNSKSDVKIEDCEEFF